MRDFDSIDTLIACFYAAVSGPAGRTIDWEVERRLYHPAARLMRTGADETGSAWIKVMSVDEYAADTAPFFAENDFYEVEVARHVDRFGNVAQVRSVYEARSAPDARDILKRGVNLIQLYHDGSRWWILSVLWDNERAGLSVPAAWSEG